MFSAEIPLRWGDLDAQAHINNAAFLEYLQEARVRFMRNGLPAGVLRTVVTDHQVTYRRPIGLAAGPVRVDVVVTRLAAASYTFGYDIVQAGEVCMTARTRCCAFDFGEHRPRRLTPREREYLTAHLAEAPDPEPLPCPELRGRGHVYSLAARWSDQDRNSHVNNVLFFDYFQEGRIAMMTQADPSALRMGSGGAAERMWLVARQDVAYQVQVPYRTEPYVIQTGVTRLGNTSLGLVGELRDSAEPGALVYASAATVLVSADPHTGRPTPLPAPIRSGLAPYLV